MKPILEPSAQDFLDAHRSDREFGSVFSHVFDEVNHIASDPAFDGEDKQLIELPLEGHGLYHICWGSKTLGRQYWYVYTPDYDEDVVRIHNIGFVGTEKPFLSRR